MEKESSIAKVRNKLSPIVTYFCMRKMIDDNQIPEEKKESIQKLINETYIMIQDHNMNDLLSLIKNDDLWLPRDNLHHLTDEELLTAMENYHRNQPKRLSHNEMRV